VNILLVNDDGIDSPGLRALTDVFGVKHCVTVVAPQRQMSGMGRSVTIYRGINCVRDENFCGAAAYAVDGTPADCVKFAFLNLGLKPDLVISGINKGENVGSDLLYSGTVGAAMEGSFLGSPSIALSCVWSEVDLPYRHIAEFVEKNLGRFLKCTGKDGVINVNFPNLPANKGIKVVKQGLFNIDEFYIADADGSYHLSGRQHEFLARQCDCDTKALFDGYITVTPLSHDITDHSRLACVEAIMKEV